MQSQLQSLIPEIIKLRRKLHANPELAYQENNTAKVIADTLHKFGYAATTGIGVTGVSAILDSGKPGKTVALRADMDALPIQELTGLPYQSTIADKMHACGHDGHVATLLAVAGALHPLANQFKGKIKFIFQPAEEGRAGAAAMIKDGILENPTVDAIFGYHNMPDIPLGIIATRPGCLLASMDTFSIRIQGKGGHAAQPHKTIDPILIGAHIVQALQSIVSRFTAPTESIVLSITQFHGGNAFNIIPDEVELAGTLRTTSTETQKAVKLQINNIINGIAQSYLANINVDFIDYFLPTINHAKETQLVLDAATQLFGTHRGQKLEVPHMISEDFSYYLDKIPGCFFFVGTGGTVSLHNSHFDFNDDIIPIAAEMLGNIAINYLNT